MKIIAFVCLTLPLITGEIATGAEANWTNRLIGTWTCVAAKVNGKPLSETTVKKLRLTLTDKRYKTERTDEVLFDSTYHLDIVATPPRITMIGTEGELIGKEAQGILSLTNDILTVCYTMPGKPRPRTFESAVGSEAHLVVWKRASQPEHHRGAE
jgi:uncharacterized protein (TIGR03067 family)